MLQSSCKIIVSLSFQVKRQRNQAQPRQNLHDHTAHAVTAVQSGGHGMRTVKAGCWITLCVYQSFIMRATLSNLAVLLINPMLADAPLDFT